MANRIKANRHCEYITVDAMAECVDGIGYGSELYLVKALWKHFDDGQRREINALLAAHSRNS